MKDLVPRAESAFLSSQLIAHLATVDPYGSPHVVPICFALNQNTIYTPLDEKPKRVEPAKLKRVRNIQHDDRVSLVIDRYDDDWARLAWVQIHGRARIVEPGLEEHGGAVTLLRQRYPQYRAMALEHHAVIAIDIERVASWGIL